MTNAVHYTIVAILPIVLFPLLGVSTSDDITTQYFRLHLSCLGLVLVMSWSCLGLVLILSLSCLVLVLVLILS